MNRRLAVAAAILCLGAGAVGCSSSSDTSASSTPSATPTTASPTADPGAADTGCNAAMVKTVTSQLTSEKNELNKTLGDSDPSVQITKLTSDDSCYLVLETNARPGDAKAKAALKPVDEGFSETLTSETAIKGVKITAADGSVIYQSAGKGK